MSNIILQSERDEDGKIQNSISYTEFAKEMERIGVMPDLYFCFIIKTLIDDFGNSLVKINKINKEQFEAQFMENLRDFLGQNTREK